MRGILQRTINNLEATTVAKRPNILSVKRHSHTMHVELHVALHLLFSFTLLH